MNSPARSCRKNPRCSQWRPLEPSVAWKNILELSATRLNPCEVKTPDYKLTIDKVGFIQYLNRSRLRISRKYIVLYSNTVCRDKFVSITLTARLLLLLDLLNAERLRESDLRRIWHTYKLKNAMVDNFLINILQRQRKYLSISS